MSDETIHIIVDEQGSRPAADNIRSIGPAADEAGQSVDKLKEGMSQLQAVLVSLGIALGVAQLIALSDTYAEITNKLRQTSLSTQDLTASTQKLYDVAQSTRQDFQGTVDLYSALTFATKNLSLSQSDLTGVVTTINQAMTLSGKSAGDVTGAMRQFSLSLSQGTLDARGLHAMLIQFPPLARAIADGLGVDVSKLKEMAAAGEITAQQLIEALQKSAPAVSIAYSKMQLTISQAFGEVHNSLVKTIGDFDKASEASVKVAETLVFIAEHMAEVVKVVSVLTAGLTAYTLSMGLAETVTISFTRILMANPLISFITILAMVTAAVIAFGGQLKLTADGSITVLGALHGAFLFVKDTIVGAYEWFAGFLKAANETKNSIDVLHPAMYAALLVLTTMVAVPAMEFFFGIATAIWAVLAPMLMFPAIAATIVAAIVAVIYAADALVNGFSHANQLIIQMGNDAMATAQKIQNSFTAKMVEATNALKDHTEKLTTDTAAIGANSMAAGLSGPAYAQAVDGAAKWSAAQDAMVQHTNGATAAVQGHVNTLNGSLTPSLQAGTFALAQHGQGWQSLTQSARNADGAISAVSQTIQTSGPGWQDLATYVRNADGEFQKATETITSFSDGYKTVTQYARDANGEFVAVAQTMEQVLDPAIDSATSRFNQMSQAAANAAKQTAQANYASAWSGNNGKDMGGTTAPNWGGYGTGSFQYGSYDLSSAQGFANGGDFIVAGAGGTDSQLVQFMATPGERVTVQTPQQFNGKLTGGQTDIYQKTAAVANGSNSGGSTTQVTKQPIMPVHVSLSIVTPNVASFQANQTQIAAGLMNSLRRVQSKLGGPFAL